MLLDVFSRSVLSGKQFWLNASNPLLAFDNTKYIRSKHLD